MVKESGRERQEDLKLVAGGLAQGGVDCPGQLQPRKD
jgi:hypothetical protein